MTHERDLEEARSRSAVRASLFGAPVEPVRLGRFVVLDKLGEGAMGVVHSAYDPELDRRIAIKVLRPDGPGAPERLFEEAKAMAKLSHPNVVAVHEVGTFEGRVFIAMEFVDGVTLRQWLADGSRAPKEVLDKLVGAGRGLGAAHAAGVVHRDFKPDNVLIDRTGRVRVLDFGLARSFEGQPADEASEVTRSSAAGTPAYMAPEQFDGVADARSDQFSFCVAAYEALFGRRPFDGDSWAKLHQNIRAGAVIAPPRAPAVSRRARAALMRGLSSDPAARYPSIDELLEALAPDRHAGSRRWWPVVGLLAAAAVVSAVTLRPAAAEPCSEPSRLLDGVWDASQRARVEAALEQTGAPAAAKTFSAVNTAFERQVDDWRRMERESCQATYVRHEQSEAVLSTRMLCLDERVQELRALSGILDAIDASTVDRAQNALAVLTPVEVCGNPDHLKQRVPPPADPELRAAVDAQQARLLEVRALFQVGRFDEGHAIAKEIYADAERLGYEPLRAAAATRLGWLEVRQGDLQKAEAYLHEGARRGLTAGNVQAMAEAWDQLGYVTATLHSDFERAERYSGYAEALVPGLVGREHTIAAILGRRGWLFIQMGRLEDGLEYQGRALEMRRAAYGPEHPQTAYSHFYIGRALYRLGRFAKGIEHIGRAERIFAVVMSPEHPQVVAALHDQAYGHYRMGDADTALEMMQRAYAGYAAARGEDHISAAYAKLDLGRIWLLKTRPERARPFIVAAVEQFRKERGETNVEYGEALTVQAKLHAAEGDVARAARTFERGLAIMDEHLERDTHRQLEAAEAFGLLELRRDRPTAAQALLERALRYYDANFGVDHPAGGSVLEGLAECATRAGRSAEAEGYSARARRARAGSKR